MANKIFSRLLSRLNSVFNKDPGSLPAFQIKSPINGTLVISDLTVTVYGQSASVPVFSFTLNDPTDDAKTISVLSLYNYINTNYPSYVCSNINAAASGLGSVAIVDGTYNLYSGQLTTINYATSILWSIFKPLTLVLDQARSDVASAIQQLAFSTSSAPFLDYWGSIFGIARFVNEPDLEYSTRLLWQTIKPRLNNIAIESIVTNATGINTNVIDLFNMTLVADGFPDAVQGNKTLEYTDALMVADGYIDNPTIGEINDTTRYSLGLNYILGAFGVYLNIPLGYSYYQYTQEQVAQIVESSRAAGTVPFYTLVQTATEIFSMVSELVESLETAIQQSYTEQRAMFFGHNDFTFYSDHWSPSMIPTYPWYQANLQIPSLSDGVLLETQEITSEATTGTSISTYFVNGFLADGFCGNFAKDLMISDGPGDSDYYENQFNIAYNFITSPGTTSYIYSPVLLGYQRYSDEPFGPRIVDTAAPDVITVDLSTSATPVPVFAGQSTKSNVSGSSYVTYTTPLTLSAPVSISGVQFNAIQLQQSNIHTAPIYVPNVSIDNFGNGWNQNYSVTRTWLIPYQDIYGNLFYEQIALPALYPPPVVNLQISNPTTTISADNVLIVSSGQVTISWSVTNAASADITETNVATNVSTTTPITYEGAITFYDLTNEWLYTISVIGNNGQTASSTIEINVGSDYVASNPTITISANPDVCVLCNTNTSIITYDIEFDSRLTETQEFIFPANSDSITINYLPSNSYEAIFSTVNNVLASSVTTGLPISFGISGLGTNQLTFTPTNPEGIYGQNVEIIYNLSLLGNSFEFNGTPITIDQETYEISQQVTVELPDPPSINGVAAPTYFADYTLSVTNYATTITQTIPIYVEAIQESTGTLSITSINPPSLVEAIGSTVNETVSITLAGTGFSSNMQVYVVQPATALGATSPVGQYLECYLTSLDWTTNTLVFIAPRLQYGVYQLIVQNSDCEGNVVEIDSSSSITYNPSTFRDPPTISSISPAMVCAGTGFVSETITVYGNNFRAGAVVYLINGTTLDSFATTVINGTTATFVMNYTTIGSYNILLVNTDESSCATNNDILEIISPSQIPDITEFVYTAPLNSLGDAYYGSNFNIVWDVSYADSISFTSSSAQVQASLGGTFPATGSLSIPIYTHGTTITLTASNPCGNTSTKTITINNSSSISYASITPAVSNLQLTNTYPQTLHLFAEAVPSDTSLASYSVEITGQTGIVYAYSGTNIAINNQIVTGITNSVNIVDVSWNGLYTSFLITVALPYVVSLVATPNPAIPQTTTTVQGDVVSLHEVPIQLEVVAVYSNGSEYEVTNSCNFSGYNPGVISVSASGLITFLSIGSTYLNCTYGLLSVSVPVGISDTPVSINSFYAQPAYSLYRLNAVDSIDLIINTSNVRSVSLNGAGMYSGGIGNYDITWAQNILQTTTYTLLASNDTDSVSINTIANVITFPKVTINWLYGYMPVAGGSSSIYSGSISLGSSNILGIAWSTSNAVSVTLSYTNPSVGTVNVRSAGTRFITPGESGTVTITAIGADGTVVSETLGVTMTGATAVFTETLIPGQTATLSATILPASSTQTSSYGIYEYYDNSMSTNGSIPSISAGTSTSSPVLVASVDTDAYFEIEESIYFAVEVGGYCYFLQTNAAAPGTFYNSTAAGNVVTVYYWDATAGVTNPYAPLVSAFDSGLPTYIYTSFTGSGIATQGPYLAQVTSIGLGQPPGQPHYFWYFTFNVPSSEYIYYRGSGNSTYSANFTVVPDATYLQNASVSTTYNAVNYDPGPSFSYVNISATTVALGQPVTISYQCLNAVSVSGSFLSGADAICIDANSFTIYPDNTQTYTLQATSIRGLSTSYSFTINVEPQALATSAAALPIPQIYSINLDGKVATASVLPSAYQENETHTLEISGVNFLSGRAATPTLEAQVRVLLNNLSNPTSNLGITVVSINSVSDTYISMIVNTYSYTNPGVYQIIVMNDVGMSVQNNNSNQLYVTPTVPNFIMLPTMSAFQGETITVYLDYVDSVRDTNLIFVINGNEYAPLLIGANMTDSTYVDTLYQQIMGTGAPISTLNNYLSLLSTDTYTRLQVYQSIRSLPGANTSVAVTAGTQVTFIANESVTGSLTVHTLNGYSANSITLVAEAVPPVVPPANTLSISGITPTLVIEAQQVTLFGYGFTANTQIYLAGVAVGKTYTSVNEISFVIPTVTASYVGTISVYEPSTNEWASYNYLYVSENTPYSNENYVLDTLFDTVSLNDSLTTISNPTTGQVGNQGQRGSYLTQPGYVVNVTGLGDLTSSTVSPSLGGYEPTNDNSIVAAEFITLSINDVVQPDPNSISLGILNHVDLAPVT
jgi:hypothetical protein